MRRSDPWLEIGPCEDYGEDNSRSPHICFDRFCGSVGVMGGYFMVAGFVVLGGFAMMPGGVFVVFGCSEMMFCGLLGHVSSIELGLRIWA